MLYKIMKIVVFITQCKKETTKACDLYLQAFRIQ